MRYCWIATLLILSVRASAQEAKIPPTPPGTPAEQALNVLQAGLKGSDPEYRVKAVLAAETIGPRQKGIDLVLEALKDADPNVRQAAASALGNMKARSAIPALQTAMDESSPEVRFAAAKALWDMGDTSGRTLIRHVLLGDRKDQTPLIKGALEDTKRTLHEPSQLAVLGIRQALGVLPGPLGMGVSAAEELIGDKGASGRAIAAEILATDPDPGALALLYWALSDRSWMVRAAAAKALGRRGNADSIPKLLALLDDAHHLPRFMAAASILKLTPDPK